MKRNLNILITSILMLSNCLVHATFSPDDPELGYYTKLLDVTEPPNICDQNYSEIFGKEYCEPLEQDCLSIFETEKTTNATLYCNEPQLTVTMENKVYFIIHNRLFSPIIHPEHSSQINSYANQNKLLQKRSLTIGDYSSYTMSQIK